MPQFRQEGRLIYWPGKGQFELNAKQGLAALCLWRARQEGIPYVRGEQMLKEADSSATKVSTLFQGTRAWGNLIQAVKGVAGAYCLPELPGDAATTEERRVERDTDAEESPDEFAEE